MLKLENTAALLSLLTASAGCVAIAFLSGYFSAIDSSLITLVSYKDLFVTLAHAFLWNAVLMLFGFIAPNLPDSSKAANVIHPDTFSQSVEMLSARPINGNWVERLMLRMLERVWRSRIRNKYILISMVVMLGVLYILLPKYLLGYLSYVFTVCMFLALGWSALVNSEQSAIRFKYQLLVGAISILLVSYIYGNYRFYKGAYYQPSRVTLPAKGLPESDYVFLRQAGESIIVFDSSKHQAIVLDKSANLLMRFASPICDESELLRNLRRTVKSSSCEESFRIDFTKW